MAVKNDIIAANGQIGNRIVAGAGSFVSSAFSNLGSWRDDDVERYIKQIAPALNGAKKKAAVQTVTFYRAIANLTGQDWKQPVITASDLTTKALRKGVGTDLVYKRPFVDMRTALSNGASMTDAINAGARRAQSLAETEVQLARRNAGLKVRKANDRIVGYVRTLTGFENCALCYVASTQRYTKSDLLPIHPGCDCGEMPIYGTQDPGQVINEVRLEATHESIAKRFGVSARDAREIDYRAIKITEHGEMGPMLTIRKQATQAAGDAGTQFGVTRVLGEFSDAENTAISLYAKNTYTGVNAGLRYNWDKTKRNVPFYVDDSDLAPWLKQIDDMDSAMAKSFLAEDLTLYRGAKLPSIGKLSLEDAQKLVGQTIEDKAFVSTSKLESFATEGFEAVDSGFEQIGFIIKAPKGSKGIDINAHKLAKWEDEQEVLLPRNSRFKVTKIYEQTVKIKERTDIKRFVEMEVINA